MPRSPQQAVLTAERQRRARQLKQQGWSQSQIAQMLGVTPGTISRWFHPLVHKAERIPRTTSTELAPHQLNQLLFLLSKGPSAYDLPGTNWTRKTIRSLIQHKLNVSVHEDDLSVILQKMGWHLDSRVARLHAWELKKQGKPPTQVAQQLGVPLPLVEQWFATSELVARTPTRQQSRVSVNSKLSPEQLQEVSKLLLKPPRIYGMTASTWTRQAIRDLLQQTYGVSFSINHIPYLLRRIKRLLYAQTAS